MSRKYSKGKNSERGSSQYSRKVLEEQEFSPVVTDKFLQERKITLAPRNAKQRKYMHMIENCNLTIATGLAGCVDKDTEFMSETGWKKISEYVVGDKVMQVSQQGLLANFVTPQEYIKLPCKEFYHFKTDRGIDQMLSEEHNVAYTIKDSEKLNKKTVSEILNTSTKNGFLGKIPTVYNYSGFSLNLSESEIRLGVAIKADAYLATESTGRFVFRLKKQRKYERLIQILKDLNYEYNYKFEDKTSFHIVTIYAPHHTKKLSDWMFCSKEDAEIIMSEYAFWDGDSNPFGNRLSRFSSKYESEASAIQYFANICGYRATVTKVIKDATFTVNSKTYEYKDLEIYIVHITKQTHIRLTPRNRQTNEIVKPIVVESIDGFKYCFTVDTGFLLLRRNGRVFVTGNSSKTYIPTMMAAQMLRAKQIDRIILIRTPTSDEESIGLLPGDVVEKTKYWLMPIIDTLNKALTNTLVEYLIKREQILCFAPEFIKGMSFTDRDFVIFDEAEDMSKTIAISTVTRQGGGKMVLCGDLRQKVLNRESGLPLLLDIIEKSPELQRKVGVVDFDDFEDIVRSEDCKLWVKAFVKHEIM